MPVSFSVSAALLESELFSLLELLDLEVVSVFEEGLDGLALLLPPQPARPRGNERAKANATTATQERVFLSIVGSLVLEMMPVLVSSY